MAKKRTNKIASSFRAKDNVINNQREKLLEQQRRTETLEAQILQLQTIIVENNRQIEAYQEKVESTENELKNLRSQYKQIRATYASVNEYRFSKESMNDEIAAIQDKYPFMPKSIQQELAQAEFLYYTLFKQNLCYDVVSLKYAKVLEALLKEWLRCVNPGKWDKRLLFGEIIERLKNERPYDSDIKECYFYMTLRDKAAHWTKDSVRREDVFELRDAVLNKWIKKVFE